MTIKKQFSDLIAFLEANQGKKVSTLMPELIEMASAKVTQKTFHKDADENVVAIYCYYHKRWELLSEVEYGAKASSSTGFNTMCKEGVSQWTKQQRDAKKAKESVLDKVASGELTADQIPVELAEIERNRQAVVESSEPSYDTLEEALS